MNDDTKVHPERFPVLNEIDPLRLSAWRWVDGNMIWGQRREFVVLARCHACELTELAIEMGLVTVARDESYVDPGSGLLCGSHFHGTLKPEYSTVELRRQPDSSVEERYKPSVTVAGLSDHLAHVGHRRELLKRMGHGRVKTVDSGKPSNKKRLKDIQSPLERAGAKESFSCLNGRTTPEVFERRMASSKLVGGNT